MAETSTYDILKNSIYAGDFELISMKKRIEELYAYGAIDSDQCAELIAAARENAKAEDSYAPLQAQIDAVGERVTALEGRVTALEEKVKSGSGSDDSGSTTTDEYPSYVQPTGATDAYQVGDKVTFNGKKYKCILANCVWDPVTYPAAWEEVSA